MDPNLVFITTVIRIQNVVTVIRDNPARTELTILPSLIVNKMHSWTTINTTSRATLYQLLSRAAISAAKITTIRHSLTRPCRVV